MHVGSTFCIFTLHRLDTLIIRTYDTHQAIPLRDCTVFPDFRRKNEGIL